MHEIRGSVQGIDQPGGLISQGRNGPFCCRVFLSNQLVTWELLSQAIEDQLLAPLICFCDLQERIYRVQALLDFLSSSLSD
jgi:hypothetical protein